MKLTQRDIQYIINEVKAIIIDKRSQIKEEVLPVDDEEMGVDLEDLEETFKQAYGSSVFVSNVDGDSSAIEVAIEKNPKIFSRAAKHVKMLLSQSDYTLRHKREDDEFVYLVFEPNYLK